MILRWSASHEIITHYSLNKPLGIIDGCHSMTEYCYIIDWLSRCWQHTTNRDLNMAVLVLGFQH